MAQKFQKEIKAKNMEKSSVKLSKSSTIYNLDPFMDADGLIRVGRRLKHSHLNNSCKHPVLLPKHEKVTDLVLKWCHGKCAHGGRGAALNELRRSGYWVVNGNSAVRSKLFKCIQCRRLRGKLGIQKMADLPSSRLMEVPPFTYCGVDMFGPFIIKQRRSEVKRYGAMFTCVNSRAVHTEVTHSLDTDSFIQALRRMIARRGNIRTIYSDNGSNFIGAGNELKRVFEEIDDKKIQVFMQGFGGDWIKCKRNPPVASHMGGVWERQIRSARRILFSLLQTHGKAFDEQSLLTPMDETEGILNLRPLTVEKISDPTSEVYVINQFWSRLRKEFLQLLQEVKKWQDKKRNFQNGGIVLLQDSDLIRNK